MSNRKDFLSATLGAAAGIGLLSSSASAEEKTGAYPKNIVFSKENPGKWSKKVGGHIPHVSVKGKKVVVETKHSMSEEHYIVRHTLVTPAGEMIASKTFKPTDAKAISEFDLPADQTELFATSFCNKHDLWVQKFNLKTASVSLKSEK